MKAFLAAVFLFIAAVPLVAQQTPSVSDEIVVTASALPEKVDETPASVSVITQQQIEAIDATDVADALRHVPGMTVIRSGSPGKATSIFTRGANSNHTLVMWNGIEIVDPEYGGYDWGQFSTAGVEQVEVVRGPYSALYGSEAVAGVINVISAPAHDDIRAELQGGSRGLRDGRASVAHTFPTLLASANFDSTRDDGFAPNDGFDRTSADGTLRWSAASTLSIGFLGRHNSFRLGIPTNLNADATALVPSPNRRQHGFESQIAVPVDQTFARFSWSALVAETRRGDTFHDPDDPFGYTDSRTDISTRRARLTTRTTTVAGTVMLGGDFARATVNDVSNFGVTLQDKRRTEDAFFVEDRLSRGRFQANAGVRYDHFDTFGSQWSPRVAASLAALGGKFRVAYGEAFRAPSVAELYSPFGGNAALQPERSSSAEAGYDRLFNASRLSITIFKADYRDLIANSGFVYANVDRARSTGAELSFERDFAQRFYALATYTYADTHQTETGRALLRRPRNSGSLIAGLRFGALDANADFTYAGDRADVRPVAPFDTIAAPGYTTVDLNLRYRIDRFTPFLSLENATDRRYEEVPGYPSPRRRFVAGITLRP